MAVVSEPPWVRKTSGVSARNGTTTHTIAFGFTSAAGNELVVVLCGAVTHTVSTGGWIERLSPVGSAELSVFTKTSTGDSSLTDTVNGSNYPVAWTVYELPAGSTWVNGVQLTNTTAAFPFPTLTGLPGQDVVVWAARGRCKPSGAAGTGSGTTWASPWVEDHDVVQENAGTDGFLLGLAHQINVTGTSITPTATTTYNGTWQPDAQRVVFAYNVASATASAPTVNAGPDAAHTVNTTFTRTATESDNGAAITARSWTVVSGPTGAGSTIGSAATLSWTPTVTGAYVIRYAATNSQGTGTDDAAITVSTVSTARPTLVADRGTAANTTAATTSAVTLTSPTSITTGNYLIARVAVDNSGANGAAPGLTVTDPRSNTWTVLGPALSDPGAASAGTTAYVAYARVTTAYQAADALTFGWGGISTAAKAIVVEEWRTIHATAPVAVPAVTANAAASSTVAVTITPTAADQLVYTCLATEGIAGDTITYDTDTTNGSWVPLTRTASANATATNNQCVAGQYKPVSAAGAQSWNATISARDWAVLAVVFAPPATASSPTVSAGLPRPVVNSGTVTLDVTATPPAGQTIVSHSWTIQSGGGSLTGATSAVPTYTAPGSGTGTAVVRDTVTASGGGTATGLVTIGYGANIVAADNQLPGTARATWDLPTSALGGVPTLQGFADGFTVDRSGTVNFKIAQSDTAGWSAEVYRLGWYAGNGARFYGTLTPTGTQLTTSRAQPAPADADPNTTRLSADCANWSTTLTWTPPAWAPSGVYVLRLNRTGGGASHVMFILRDDARTADLMFMPADSTWTAYNAFGGMGSANWLGGNSLYLGTAINQYDNDAARFVSYNRPFVNRQAAVSGVAYGAVEWSTFFTGEYPMLRFLERNGVDVKYYGCIDAAGDNAGTKLTGNGSTVGGVSAAMFVGHNEYWSNVMRAGWEAAKTAGVNIFSCAGNEVFWRFVGSNNDAAGRPRTWECFKSTIAGRGSTGRPQWTGTWRDPDGAGKGGNLPENLFTGTVFVVNGPDLRSLRVPFAGGYSAQPLWRHTTVASLTTGQTYTSPSQILGFEWDTYGPAGTSGTGANFIAAPHAQARYCSDATYSIPAGLLLTDAGDEYSAAGTATHRLVVHPNGGGNGGITFGTGTINWAFGLDNANTYHGTAVTGNDNTDVVIQQATINMLCDMGAPAATLMGTLTEPTPVVWFAGG